MSHTDPIGDMVCRIRNAIMAEKREVLVPHSKIKVEIIEVLKREGYIAGYKIEKSGYPAYITIDLKYLDKKKNVIEGVERISKPGKRIYVGADDIPKVLGGLGVSVLSTSKGIMTGKDCKRDNVGGEMLLTIW